MQLWKKWSTFTQSDWTKRHVNAFLCLTASFFFLTSVLKLKLNVSLTIQDEVYRAPKRTWWWKKYEKGGKMLLHSHISIAFPKKLWARTQMYCSRTKLLNSPWKRCIFPAKWWGFCTNILCFHEQLLHFHTKLCCYLPKQFLFSKLWFLIISFTKVSYGNANVYQVNANVEQTRVLQENVKTNIIHKYN